MAFRYFSTKLIQIFFFGFIVLVITFQTAYNMSTFGSFVFEILACKHGGFCAEKRAFAGGDVALCFNEEIGCGNGSYSRGEFMGTMLHLEKICQRWFGRFRSGDFDVNDKERPGQLEKV